MTSLRKKIAAHYQTIQLKNPTNNLLHFEGCLMNAIHQLVIK